MLARYRFITDEREYASLRALVASRFSTGAALPDLVFSEPGNRYSFMDFDLLLSAVFWTNVRALNAHAGLGANSEIVIFMPDPDRKSATDHGKLGYGMFIVDSSLPAAQYEAAASAPLSEKKHYSINVVANRLLISPRKGGWKLWGCREFEVGILSHPKLGVPELGRDWMSAVDVLETFAFKNRRKANDSRQFCQKFLATYTAS